jgi:preprotein translocase subunit YajC
VVGKREIRPLVAAAIFGNLLVGISRSREVFLRTGRQSMSLVMAMLFQSPGGLGGALGSPLIMMVVVMGIFYVMLILPQQKQRKKLQEMLSALKAGDKVITNGGIYGTINGFDGDTVILKIADTGSSAVKIRIARSAITQVEATEDAK